MGDESGYPEVRFRCSQILSSNRCRWANSQASSKPGILVISVALEITLFSKASTIARLVSALIPKSSAFTMIFRDRLGMGIFDCRLRHGAANSPQYSEPCSVLPPKHHNRSAGPTPAGRQAL